MKPNQFPATPLWWEIVYIGGTRLRGTTFEEWQAAPAEGVLVVRQPVTQTYTTGDKTYHFTVRCYDHDYYWIDADGLIQQGNVLDALALPPDTIKRGAWATQDEYRAAWQALGQDVLFADEEA